MAITTADFNKIWASTSPLTPYEFSESNYKEGWNFVGATPPSRQMWDFLQKNTDEKIKYIYTNMIPCGIVQAFAGNTVPDGWLLCDGSAVSRTDYADLYTVIGDTYGAGDGSTTFNVPNLIDRFVQGNATSGTVKTAGLPNITGDFEVRSMGASTAIINPVGAFAPITKTVPSYTALASGTTATERGGANLDASRSSSIYGNSATVQPPALAMQYIIKY